MDQVEYEDSPKSYMLDFVGSQPPAGNLLIKLYSSNSSNNSFLAPQNFSFACADTFVYRKENVTLTLKNIQVQPRLEGTPKFGRVYECVGFMTPAILSGIFITSMLAVALALALTAIMDIKPPNRFESRSSKQLTFTVQE